MLFVIQAFQRLPNLVGVLIDFLRFLSHQGSNCIWKQKAHLQNYIARWAFCFPYYLQRELLDINNINNDITLGL